MGFLQTLQRRREPLSRWGLLALLFTGLATPSFAQVVKIRDFNLSAPYERTANFSVAVTSSGDVLSFIAKDSGEWQLYRVKNWRGGPPFEDKVLLPGFFSKEDRTDRELLEARVFTTADGKYAVCIGSAEWLKRVGGWVVGRARSDDVISVVDLSTFKVLLTARTATLGLLEFHDIRLDNHGHVLVNSISQDKPSHSLFIQLDIPSLAPAGKCSYRLVEDSPGKEHPEIIDERGCRESLKSMALDQYLSEGQRRSDQQFAVCQKNRAEFCRVPGEFTADGKFGVGDRREGHDSFLGGWVLTTKSYIIFSTSKGLDLDEIKEPTNDSVRKVLAFMDGRDYLLVMQGGTHLDAYELKE